MSSGGGAHDGAQPSGGVPGKRTLTQGLEPIFRKADLGGGSASADSPAVTTALGGGGGEPLPTGLRASVEGATGGDLSAARVHREPEAVAAASALRARAFTYGNDIFLGAGEDVGDTRLMAHEATHVLQQDRGALQRKGREVVAESDPAEVEADRVADAVATGGHHALPVMSLGAGGIVRTPVNHVTTSAEIPPVVVSERAPTIARSPKGGTQDIHDQLIEDFRRENGFPPHGTDPLTGAQDGPTNSEIRFGGLLDRWLANRQSGHASSSPQAPGQPQAQTPGTGVRGVAAPATAPTIAVAGNTNVVGVCQGAIDIGACRQHQSYTRNILPQAIANIRSVSSPYSAAIATLYNAALPAAQVAAAPVPGPGGSLVDANGGPVTVTFGATTHTFTQFTISLQQWQGGANGRALGAGGPRAFVILNEASNDALMRNLSGIEATMIHETIHLFMEIVESRNAARAAGTVPSDPNLDRGSYAVLKASLATALQPFMTQVRALPSVTAQRHTLTVQADAAITADTFISEALARTEAGVFTKQRAGQAFTAADLSALPPFTHSLAYWTPSPSPTDFATFLQANQTQLDAVIQPIILQIGERYLNLRP